MGHLKDIANQSKLQTFPSSTFEIEGLVPADQCSEAKIEGDNGTTVSAPDRRLTDNGKFAGFTLLGTICTILTNPGGNTGNFDIVANTDDRLTFIQDPGFGSPTEYYIHNGGDLILTRNIQSFAEFIRAAGYAYTIKGGKLFTNIPSAQLQNACTILFDPLT